MTQKEKEMKERISQEEIKAKSNLDSKLKEQEIHNNQLMEQKLSESEKKSQVKIHSQEE